MKLKNCLIISLAIISFLFSGCSSYSKFLNYTDNGKTEKLLKLVESHPEYKKQSYLGKAIINASKSGHLEMVKALVDIGARVNYYTDRSPYDKSAVFIASKNNHPEIVKYLISAGAHTFCYERNYTYQIQEGSYKENTSRGTVEYIFEKAKLGHTALSYAVVYGNYDLVKLMIEKECNPNMMIVIKQINLSGGLGMSMLEGPGTATVNLGGGGWAKIEGDYVISNIIPDFYKTTLLNLAIQKYQFEIMELLLQSGADANNVDSNGKSAIQIARALPAKEKSKYVDKIKEYE